MKFTEIKFKGVFILELAKHEDERGLLTRIWDKNTFKKYGIKIDVVQSYISHSNKKGTIRGLHYQVKPFAEAKLTKCIKGSIYEVIIDLRPKSKTYKKWTGFKFNAQDNKMLFIPPYFAHAILSLEDNTQFLNFSSQPYTPEFERGIRYNDPSFKINWPINIKEVSEKDFAWEDFK